MTHTTETAVLCPKCGSKMQLRTNRVDGSRFYGCLQYRNGCRGSRPFGPDRRKIQTVAAERKIFTGTDEQQAFWKECREGSGHICCSARAGSGKSTSSVEGMWRVGTELTQGYFAFNTSIVQEFRAKAPPHVAGNVQTFNALGRSILMATFPNSILAKDKTINLLDQIYQPTTTVEYETHAQLENACRKLCGLIRGCMLTDLSPEVLSELSFLYNVELTSEIEAKVFKLVPKLIELHKTQTASHDFTDQMWLPVVLNLPAPGLDIVWIDEAQDLNRVKMELAIKILNKTGRVVYVGDGNQAINGFSGSAVNSMSDFEKMLIERTIKPVVHTTLTYTFRCGSEHIRAVNHLVPDIRTPATKLDGSPWHRGEIIDTTMDDVIKYFQPGDMGICRCNAPLTGVAYSLIKMGVPCVIKGRDIGVGLVNLVNRLKAKTIGELETKLHRWVSREIEKLNGNKNAESQAQSIEDRAGCIYALCEECDDVPQLIGRIETLFAMNDTDGKPKNVVVLSSIHKAKGMEADRVVWIKPEIRCKTTNEDQRICENVNLVYVAGTRPKYVLIKAWGKRPEKED